MRLVAKYTKRDRIKYISHLDLIRTVQRALRRGNIPIAYTQGFNPHPKLAFASPLSVGITSQGEYMDLSLEHPMNPEYFCHNMNKALPKGMEILGAVEIDNKTPSLMSLVDRAEYKVVITKPITDIESYVEGFLKQQRIIVEKESKRGIRQVDIRDMIHRLHVEDMNSEEASINMLLSIGGEKSLNPELLLNGLFDYIGKGNLESTLYRIHRLNLYIHQNSQWVTPLALGKGEAPVEQTDHC